MNLQRIAVLGSTGSIGTQALDVVERNVAACRPLRRDGVSRDRRA